MKENFNPEEIVEQEQTAVQEAAEKKTTAAQKTAAQKAVAKGKNIYQKLLAIQTTLKAPKNLYNKFGKYNYRNAEGILEAVKPYLSEQECILIMEDQIEVIGTEAATKTDENGVTVRREAPRRYVKAIAHLIDCETGKEITTNAYANECDHTGMSGDQCTGTASSYARKYCLNALFLLDDTKDSDTDEMKEIENAAKTDAASKPNNVQPMPQKSGTGKAWGSKTQPTTTSTGTGKAWGQAK